MLFQQWRTQHSPSTFPILDLSLKRNYGTLFHVNQVLVYCPAGFLPHLTLSINLDPEVLDTTSLTSTTMYAYVFLLLLKLIPLLRTLTVCKQLYLICNGSESRRVDGSESNCIYNCDTESNSDDDVGVGVAAYEVAEKTIDPNTDLPIDWESWSIFSRWMGFKFYYDMAEEEYALRKD
ncbi:hypothetical protein BJ165DRAFT_1426875 [Panaeolus papilionaceus]|nr:hypothetical protein BJ165DRAFT_1426875 [Panaeolus papilionaceus]